MVGAVAVAVAGLARVAPAAADDAEVDVGLGAFLGPRRWSTRPALAVGALVLPRLAPWVAVVVRL